MSWTRLLAVGRSVGHIGNQPSPYKMTQGLPKFGRAQAPVRLRVRATEASKASIRERAPESADEQLSITPQRKVAQVPAKAGRAFSMFHFLRKKLFGKDPKMNSVEAGARVAPATTFDVPPQAYPLGRWTLFKNPFVKRSKPAEPVAPVQGELLLDMVKPIRNDLSDSDLEVVAASAKMAPAGELPAKPPEPLSEPVSESAQSPHELEPASPTSPAAWGRVKDQFFGAGKS